MREINLLSITNAFNGLNQSVCGSYFDFFNVSPKDNEINDLSLFIKQLREITSDFDIYNDYFFGYTIPQISKEFDLLRFGNDYIVNIELKSENTGDKMCKQLLRNQYYLNFLNKKVYYFTYVSNENILYTLDEHNLFIITDFNFLFEILANQCIIEIPDINKIFNPSNYLVSPFNSTNEFIKGDFFLTGHQEEIKKECIKIIRKEGTSFMSICGKSGTGKTLLTFDIAKEFITENVLVIHCGNLNAGHLILTTKFGWNIVSIKSWDTCNLSDFSLIIIDETQRIYPYQLILIIKEIKSNNGNCIFSYDKNQCLRQWEINNNIPQVIETETSSIIFTLTAKIRTNQEISSFIMKLFDKSKISDKIDRRSIDLNYYKNNQDAKNKINLLGKRGWKIINFTQSNRDVYPYDEYCISNEENTHEVIGQEFDNVIAVIDECFYYNGNHLCTRNYSNSPYYLPSKMLFQVMTRTRRKLSVIVINNEEIMERCLSILGYPSKVHSILKAEDIINKELDVKVLS